MKAKEVLIVVGGVSRLTDTPEMTMGIQYFEGDVCFRDGQRVALKGLVLSTYFVLPIADKIFLGEFYRVFGRDFFNPAGTHAELCCIREDNQCGWTVVWDDNLPNQRVELVTSPSAPLSGSDQVKTFLAALSQAFPQQQVLIPPPGTPRPLSKQTSGDDGFLRFTYVIPDRRVNTGTGDVAPGTFCTPFRDGQKISCGFEAVGRFALPVPLPYRHVVLLLPPAGTNVDIGTVAPNFGQAGGGVEALFPNGFNNPNLHYHMLPEY